MQKHFDKTQCRQKGVSTLILIIIIIAVAVVAVGGVLAYQYFTPKTQPVVQVQQNQNCVPEGGQYGAPKTAADLCCAGLVERPTTNSGTVGVCVKPADQHAGLQTYANTQYGFEFQYPSDFANVDDLTTVQKNSLNTYMGACNRTEMGLCYIGKQTSDGFAVASFSISPSASISMQDCQKSEQYGPAGDSTQTQQTTINGIVFYEAQFNDAGLGHYVDTDSYRTYHGGVCYTIDLNIESDRGTLEKGLSADFSSMMNSKLKSILSTFKFTK